MEFNVGVVPTETAPLTNRATLSHPLAPKLKHNSTSRLPPSMICVDKFDIARETPLMQFPMSIPQIGITYWGFQRGEGRIITRKAKAPTDPIEIRIVRKVRSG
mmetsp:Transcript_29900/g.58085  ORF Transcript_29900/g.58085 Transcript_29900/m.58085 type:complete len:103 (+) Transcript_29900:705-1013(+)